MGANHNMPFGIEFVTGLLGLPRIAGTADRESFYTTCPFCKRKRKLNINIAKDTWHCPACGEGGGMIKLYAMCREIDQKEAARELFHIYNGTDDEQRAVLFMRKKEILQLPERNSAAPIKKRDAAYRSLLSDGVLSLEDFHREALKKRGLSDEVIESLGYKSTPQHDLDKAVSAIQERGADLTDIPGFYGMVKKKMVYRKPGFFIPVKTLWGQISGLQIRYDDLPPDAAENEKESYRKYTWFYSADHKTGTSMAGCENIHHAGFSPGTDIKKVCLTEGALKADVASYISRMPFIGLTGVSNTGQLREDLETLRKLGTKQIYICLDMDYRTKESVEKAMLKIIRICKDSGIDTVLLTWPEEYKGIDDLLLYKREHGLI